MKKLFLSIILLVAVQARAQHLVSPYMVGADTNQFSVFPPTNGTVQSVFNWQDDHWPTVSNQSWATLGTGITTLQLLANWLDTNIVTQAYADAHYISGIATGSITSALLASGSVTTVALADYSVTHIKLATNAVGTENIIDASVTSNKLADNAVSTSNVVDGSITAEKLSPTALSSVNFGLTAPSVYKVYVTNTASSNAALTLTGSIHWSPAGLGQPPAQLSAYSSGFLFGAYSGVNSGPETGSSIFHGLDFYVGTASTNCTNLVLAVNTTGGSDDTQEFFMLPVKKAYYVQVKKHLGTYNTDNVVIWSLSYVLMGSE